MNLSHPEAARAFAPLAQSADRDYGAVRDAIAFISEHWQSQPLLQQVADQVGLSVDALHRRFTRIAGLTPKAFLQAVTMNHSRALLSASASVLDASLAAGLSGPSRLHDLFVSQERMPPGVYRAGGAGLVMEWGLCPSPFGDALIITHGGRLAGLGFAEPERPDAALADFRRRWPRADFVEAHEKAVPLAAKIFDPSEWQAGAAIRIVMIGSDFEVRVWQALLDVPFGSVTSYSTVAERINRPKAARAVGAAIGRNPISFVVPCHRVLGKGGSLTGYHWGLARKRALLGWEAGLSAG
jgi:AraC family transcriptional regulator of adaptative response/methylated-DNA-[protein]-cysteine methyltransferase